MEKIHTFVCGKRINIVLRRSKYVSLYPMASNIENKIRFNIASIYILVIVIIAAMVLFIVFLNFGVERQKENIEKYRQEMSLAYTLIQKVNFAQDEINLYLSTKNKWHYTEFLKIVDQIKVLSDSIHEFINTPYQTERLAQIEILLKEKGYLTKQLNQQFTSENPIASIDKVLLRLSENIGPDSVIVNRVVKDTIIQQGPKKNFWKKLSGLFSSSQKDSILVVSTIATDTLQVVHNDSIPIVSQISEITGLAREKYSKQMRIISRNLEQLIVADQVISNEIAALLMDFYRQTIELRLHEIDRSEKLIHKSNIYLVVISIVTLALLLICILQIVKNVNKGYRMRKELQDTNDRIKQLMEARNRLLLSVSHDLKTPLNSILGLLELRSGAKEFTEQDLKVVQYSTNHILALLGNLLDFSAIEQGNSKVYVRKFNMHKLCEEVVTMFEPLAGNKKLDFIYAIHCNKNRVVESDPTKIKQILINILSNSIKYTTEGQVTFTADFKDNKAVFRIEDTGTGIPKEQLNYIFQAFSRLESNAYLSDGTGLGLYVVKGMLELLGGTIDIASQAGKGSSFVIQIPLVEVQNTDSISPLKILLIDDDLFFLHIMKDMLKHLGHEPITCNSQNELELHLSLLHEFDLVMTDMEMGKFNGEMALNMVRTHTDNLPVMLLTGRDDLAENAVKQMGFSGLIRKPVSMHQLKDLLGEGRTEEKPLFTSLSEMFENDIDAIQEILQTMNEALSGYVEQINEAIKNNDFQQAQAVCHKMLPMMIQIEATDKIDILKKMDSMRTEGAENYLNWQEDMLQVIEQVSVVKSWIGRYKQSSEK